MKMKMMMLATLAGALVTPAFAQVEVTITGSTAFRSIAQDRVASLFDTNASFSVTVLDSNTRTYTGTMSKVLTPTNTPVTVRMSFSGSATGMQAVQNGTPVTTVNTNSTTTAKVPDLAFSDVYPSSANPPIPGSAFGHQDLVGVIPFVFVKNNGAYLSGITNITRDQALLLMTAGGVMPATFLGGTNDNVVWFTGRDSGSGTRITTEKCVGFLGAPFMYAKIGANYVQTNGFTSGSFVATTLNTNQDFMSYLGLGDYNTVSNNVAKLAYNGVAYSSANVTSGKYGVWGYEHVVSRIGLSASQDSIRTALVNAISDSTFQHSSSLYVGNFEVLNDMQVERGADGGEITSLNF